MKAQLMDVLPSLLFAGLMGGSMWLVGSALGPTSDFPCLIAQAVTGVVIYLALNWLAKAESLYEAASLVAARVTGLPGTANNCGIRSRNS
jgi:hypothetical protein